MRKSMKWLAVAFSLAALLGGCKGKDSMTSSYQGNQSNQMMPGEDGLFPPFNPKQTVKIKGRILTPVRLTGPSGREHLELLIDSNGQQIPVLLGPEWYVGPGISNLQIGAEVEVKGAKVQVNGAQVIVAYELKTGNYSLKLRDDKGVPQWSGWKQQ